MEKKRINILLFSPSARKVWVQPMRKVLNPSYWLLAYLAARLSDIHNVYTITKSFDPVARVKQYNNEHIDVVLSIGASYNPATLRAEFNRGFPMHERAFEIGDITKHVFAKFNPIHININADVRTWFDSLTDTFGKHPDVFITEQQMCWQPVGYLLNNDIWERSRKIKTIPFFFSGGVKSRQNRFIQLTKNIPGDKIIHGGGWEKYLNRYPEYKCAGFMDWFESVQTMIKSKYSLTLHESVGNADGWITAKLFENIGARSVTFVCSEYDKNELFIKRDHVLRVDGDDDIADKIKRIGYDKLLAEQNKLINPEWANLESFFVQPFFKKFNSVL